MHLSSFCFHYRSSVSSALQTSLHVLPSLYVSTPPAHSGAPTPTASTPTLSKAIKARDSHPNAASTPGKSLSSKSSFQ